MHVVSHSYGGYGRARDGGSGCYVYRTEPGGVVHMSGDARELPECEVISLITPPSMCTALGRVEPEFVDLPGKALKQDAMRRLVRCSCSRLAVLHGIPLLLLLLLL